MQHRRSHRVLALCVSFVFIACGGDNPGLSDAAPTADAETGADAGPVGTSGTVGTSGGNVGVDDGPLAGSSVDIPSGALDEYTEITIESGTDVVE